MGYLVCVLVVCVSAYIGRLIVKRYVDRDNFYAELIQLIEYIKNNIIYKQSKIKDLFNEYMKKDKVFFKSQLDKMKDCVLTTDNNSSKLKKTEFSFLKSDEISQIERFLRELGTSNSEIEISKINGFISGIKTKKEEVYTARKQNEGLIFKVSIAIGVILSILIV